MTLGTGSLSLFDTMLPGFRLELNPSFFDMVKSGKITTITVGYTASERQLEVGIPESIYKNMCLWNTIYVVTTLLKRVFGEYDLLYGDFMRALNSQCYVFDVKFSTPTYLTVSISF